MKVTLIEGTAAEIKEAAPAFAAQEQQLVEISIRCPESYPDNLVVEHDKLRHVYV